MADWLTNITGQIQNKDLIDLYDECKGWQDTGILKGTKLRELANEIKKTTHQEFGYALSLAERSVYDEVALRWVKLMREELY